MWEWPDRRVWWFLGPVFPLAVALAVLPPGEGVARVLEAVLYAWCVALGLSVGILSIRERYSLFHPSVTADDSPIQYWIEVLLGCFVFAGIGAWQTIRLLSDVF